MILQSLVNYYENLAKQDKISKPGWCTAKVSYAIDLSSDGMIKSIIYLKSSEERGKKTVDLPLNLIVPEMVTRSSGVSANFLCDNAKYFLGIEQNGTNSRVQECFNAAKEKHISILSNVDNKIAKAICLFFENWNPEKAKENIAVCDYWDELTDGSNLIFCMGNDYANENPEIRECWEHYNSKLEDGGKGICMVTGKKDVIARIHRGIKGVPGAQSSGAALVSFNAPSFESYEKEQSYNAPVGKYAEYAYTTALNHLLSIRDFRFSLGDSMVVYWAESGENSYQKTFSWALNPGPDNEETLRNVFGNLKKDLSIDIEDLEVDFTKLKL